LLRALASEGLLARLFPQRVGGHATSTPSVVDLCVLREALARESPDAENTLAIQVLGAVPLLLGASPSLAKRWLPPLCGGELVAAFAMTEPDAGSDAGALSLKADGDGSGYRLSGVKAFISNAPEADVYTVFARTDPNAGSRGITAFAIPGDAPGLSGTHQELLAPHPIGRLEFDGVAATADQVVGEVNQGFRLGMQTLDLFRPSVGAMVLGLAEAALDAAVQHAGVRRQFGRPLREFQAVSHRLADMATRVEAARLLVYSAATAYDAGAPRIGRRSAMAKLFATETAQDVIDGAIQVHGAVALERGHLLEQLYRRVRAPRIYEGTSEIQREIIARDLYREG
jgi:alkylation response protein AidB-like acyl-CoA dehydrogenase